MVMSTASTAVDLAPLLQLVVQSLLVVVASVAAYFIQGHMKDDNARRTVLTAIENGVQFGMNKVNGALMGRPLDVQLGSSVAAQAVKYATTLVPDALARLGLGPEQLAKLAVAKLPAVDGHMSDDAIGEIAGVASGRIAPPAKTDTAALVVELAPLLEQLIAAMLAKRAASAAAPPVSPAT
jgi:hypothetical protein